MNFGSIILNRSIRTMQNFANWIQTASLFILKLKIFMKILHMVLKKDLGGKIMTEFATLKPKA